MQVVRAKDFTALLNLKQVGGVSGKAHHWGESTQAKLGTRSAKGLSPSVRGCPMLELKRLKIAFCESHPQCVPPNRLQEVDVVIPPRNLLCNLDPLLPSLPQPSFIALLVLVNLDVNDTPTWLEPLGSPVSNQNDGALLVRPKFIDRAQSEFELLPLLASGKPWEDNGLFILRFNQTKRLWGQRDEISQPLSSFLLPPIKSSISISQWLSVASDFAVHENELF
jgi:hypothetical protein